MFFQLTALGYAWSSYASIEPKESTFWKDQKCTQTNCKVNHFNFFEHNNFDAKSVQLC